MIVAMKKVSLVVLETEKRQALQRLRRLGLLHITERGEDPRIETLTEEEAVIEAALALLPEALPEGAAPLPLTAGAALEKAREILTRREESTALRKEVEEIGGELSRLCGFGPLDPEALSALARAGVSLSLYEMPPADFKRLDEDIPVLSLTRTKTAVRFAVPEGTDGPRPPKEYRVTLPAVSTAEMEVRRTAAMARIDGLAALTEADAVYRAALTDALAARRREATLLAVESGMTGVSVGDGASALAYFTGYLPADDLPTLSAAARENAWGMLAEDPTVDDPVPTKLQNNPFVSLIYPLTDFLGTVPGYFEYDISAWFLGFILVFFGIIFGDGGYGLAICAVAAVPILRARLQKKPVPPTFLLIGLMGLATVVWGTVTCAWFGIDPDLLPAFLRNISVPVLSNVNADRLWYPFWTGGEAALTTSQNVQIFCFALALVQLSSAHLKGFVRHRRSLRCLGALGSVFQLLGVFYVVLSLVVNGAVFPLSLTLFGIPMGTAAIALVGGGFALSFVFANYEGSIGKSVLASLKNIVSGLLGVVNMFSDIVSYIRLWAVGLAGAAISATVNELAGPLLGNFLFILVAIVLLVFGHGLNMILNVLSVIVHGVRLNTLEFSSHLDMSWGGQKYEPFRE